MDPLNPTAVLTSIGLSPLALLVLLGLAVLFSSYIKLATALGMIRFGLGVNSLPSAFVTGGLAFALTVFVMQPTFMLSAGAMDRVLGSAAAPAEALKARALDAAILEWKGFIKAQAHPEEQRRFTQIARTIDTRAKLGLESGASAKSPSELESELADSWRILAPAFVVSELKEAFITGLSLLLPFLVIDLLIANLLVAVGLDRLNPTTVAFPCKVLLFVMVDGWTLIAGNLAATYAA